MPTSPAIIWYEEVKSTNDVARNEISSLDNMSVIAARKQTHGRGQGEHKWSGASGKSLTFSFVMKMGLDACDALYLTKAITHAICSYLADRGIAASVKLPNDIYVGDRKICGILIENTVFGKKLEFSIIGIGLNVGQEWFEEWIPNPVSMKMLTGKDYDIAQEMEHLHKKLVRSASLIMTKDGRTGLDEWFSANSFRLGV